LVCSSFGGQIPAFPVISICREDLSDFCEWMSATIQISREELYRKVWSTPAIRLAKEFGISDVALNKTCKRMGVPRPERGHWARIAAGQKPIRPPLPPAKEGQPALLQFNVKENIKRRKEWRKPVPKPNEKPPPMENPIQLLSPDGALHRLAERARTALQKGKPEQDGRIKLCLPELPFILIWATLGDRLVVSLDALFRTLEDRGVTLQPKEDHGDSGLLFVKGPDWLRLSIEEPLIQVRREPTQEDKLRPSSTWQLTSTQLAGHLAFTLEGPRGLSGRKHWSETERKPLEDVLFAVVLRMEQLYESFEVKRVEEKEREIRCAEEERRRAEEKKVSEHNDALEKIARKRARNLWKAAEWWRIHRDILSFIEECENRWKASGEGPISNDQVSWLVWAKECAEDMSPFTAVYPDPAIDGAFDASAIPVGGKHPSTRDMPDPPSMKPQESQASPYSSYHAPAPSPYPFWLRHRRS
jgi:hypothetical protein